MATVQAEGTIIVKRFEARAIISSAFDGGRKVIEESL